MGSSVPGSGCSLSSPPAVSAHTRHQQPSEHFESPQPEHVYVSQLQEHYEEELEPAPVSYHADQQEFGPHPFCDWINDDDTGYVLIPISGEEFEAMEEVRVYILPCTYLGSTLHTSTHLTTPITVYTLLRIHHPTHTSHTLLVECFD